MHRLALTLALCAIAVPAAAQPAPWSPERTTAGWVFTPSFVFGVLSDSNPTTRNDGALVQDEMVTLVNPRTEFDFNGRRAKFAAGYSGTLERYQELRELTRYDQRGRIDARYQMTPRLLFQTRHSFAMVPTTDQLDLEGIPFTRVGSRTLTDAGGFKFDFSPRSNMRTEYVFQWVDFDRQTEGPDFRFLQGGHSHNPSLEYEYALTRRVKLGGLYMYRYVVIDAGEEIFGTHRAQGVVQAQLTPTTSMYARVGIDHVKLITDDQERSGPSYAAGVTQRIRRAVLSGAFERAFMPTFGFGALTASRTLQASFSMPFASGRASAGASFTYRSNDPVVLSDILVKLDSYWTQVNAGYAVARWLRVEGFMTLTQQYSSAQGDVERTRIGIQFVTSKPVRIQ
jgi:hypothetical protein